jgi:hypothetical protein
MAAEGPTRSDTYSVKVTVVGFGIGNTGVWDKLSGGAVDSEEFKYSPGGMADQVSLGGRVTTDNVTVSRLYRLSRDHGIAQKLINAVGKARVIITKLPLDVNGNAGGIKPITYQGTLKRVAFPDHDSESSAAGLLELEITTDSVPSVGV